MKAYHNFDDVPFFVGIKEEQIYVLEREWP